MTVFGSTPDVVDVTHYQGDAWSRTFRFWTNAAHTIPLDVSGRTFTAKIRTSRSATTAVGSLTIDATNAATGTIVVSLGSALAALLAPGAYVWDVEWLVSGADLPTTVCTGAWIESGDVTRA